MLPLLILLSLPLPSRTFIVITEGIEARPHSRPYMTAIKTSGGNNKWELCGGFLVREDFVLTVAHCLKRMIFFILGAHNATRNETTRQVIHVIQSFPHPMYKSDTLVNDIMLLKLKNKVRLNTAVKTISLPRSQDWVWPEQVCRVAGWRTENGKFSATFQEVELEVQDKKKCKQFFIYYDDGHETMGDHGGGGAEYDNVAQGIVSYRYQKDHPKVFTRISSFVLRIHRVMNAP